MNNITPYWTTDNKKPAVYGGLTDYIEYYWIIIGGGSQESNLPGRFLIPLTSFEDWAAHQRPWILRNDPSGIIHND